MCNYAKYTVPDYFELLSCVADNIYQHNHTLGNTILLPHPASRSSNRDTIAAVWTLSCRDGSTIILRLSSRVNHPRLSTKNCLCFNSNGFVKFLKHVMVKICVHSSWSCFVVSCVLSNVIIPHWIPVNPMEHKKQLLRNNKSQTEISRVILKLR